MRINPINTNYHSNSFRSVIKPTEALKEGFVMMEKCADSGTMKNMNSVKEFVDSLVKISESTNKPEFKIEIDKRRDNYTYTKINGRRVSGGVNDRQLNIQDSYLVVEGTKRYASKLEDIQDSYLDILKSEIEDAETKLEELKFRYSQRIKAELQQAKKFIFDDVK